MHSGLKTVKWFPAGSNVVFYGYPGSGRTNALMKIAAKLKLGLKIPITIVNCDTWHLGKSNTIESFAEITDIPFHKMEIEKIAGLQDKNLLVYLRFDERSYFSEENKPSVDLNLNYFFQKDVFQNKKFKKVLVLDCTRKDEINDALIESIGKDFIDAIIPAKIDMVPDKASVCNYLCSINIPVVFVSFGEDILKGGAFVDNTVISKIFEKAS
jgi:flagellar biosynthesis GTPase FlhF